MRNQLPNAIICMSYSRFPSHYEPINSQRPQLLNPIHRGCTASHQCVSSVPDEFKCIQGAANAPPWLDLPLLTKSSHHPGLPPWIFSLCTGNERGPCSRLEEIIARPDAGKMTDNFGDQRFKIKIGFSSSWGSRQHDSGEVNTHGCPVCRGYMRPVCKVAA